jgi:hypothetical protein
MFLMFTITMYCVTVIATVVFKIPEKSFNSNIKSVINLDNIKVFRRFVYHLYINVKHIIKNMNIVNSMFILCYL